MDISSVPYEHDHDENIGAMRDMRLSSLKSRAEADAALRDAVPEAGVRQFLLHNLVSSQGANRWRINLDALPNGMESIMGCPDMPTNRSYQEPTLFLRGEGSDYVLPEQEPLIRSLFPNAAIETVEGAGHWLHAERPDAVRESVGRYLAERLSESGRWVR